MFEERLFALIGTLERIAAVLTEAQIPFELIGGGAVMVQVNQVEPAAVRNTKDLDIMIRRADLDRVKAVAAGHGFTFRHAALKANQAMPNRPIRPERVMVHDVEVAVIPLPDLFR